jgi:hypothetical protein
MGEIAIQKSPLLFDDLPIEDLGTISIRVFVLPPKRKKGGQTQAALPLDVEEGEEFMLDEKGATPVSSYLEAGRGKRCVVYLVNGQRQEFDDNGFIVQDLGFRYLRARMMIMVDRWPRPGGDREVDARFAAGLLSGCRTRSGHQADHRNFERRSRSSSAGTGSRGSSIRAFGRRRKGQADA